jgi:hypothetical protein
LSILDIEFEWPVATCGYIVRKVRLEPRAPTAPPIPLLAQPVSGLFITPRCAEPTFRTVRPLAMNPNLYLQFAHLDDDPNAFADFATSWGFLFGWSYKQSEGEDVYTWREERRLLRRAFEVAEFDPRGLLHFAAVEPEDGERKIAPPLRTTLVWTGKLALRLRPPTLVAAMWLQFLQAMTQGGEIKSCDHCGAWFERGPGTERGRKARFCSDVCRFGFHNQRRTKKSVP